jgi:hypothetical protein
MTLDVFHLDLLTKYPWLHQQMQESEACVSTCLDARTFLAVTDMTTYQLHP